MDDYYGELHRHPDPARAVGWENAGAQAARFAIIGDRVRDGDEVLDLGAGLGDLGRYLMARGWTGSYRGIERDARLLARGLARTPAVHVERGDFTVDDVGTADVVAAIGVLVDGGSLRSDAVRFARLRGLLAVTRAVARRVGVIVALDQDRLEAHPRLSLDPALGGIRRAELAWLARDAEVVPVLEMELALVVPGAG